MNNTDKSATAAEYYQRAVHKIDDLEPFIALASIVDSLSKEGRINDIRRELVVFCVAREEQQCNQARKDELFKTYTQVIGDEKAPHSRYSRVTKIFTEYLKKRNAELQVQAKETEGDL